MLNHYIIDVSPTKHSERVLEIWNSLNSLISSTKNFQFFSPRGTNYELSHPISRLSLQTKDRSSVPNFLPEYRIFSVNINFWKQRRDSGLLASSVHVVPVLRMKWKACSSASSVLNSCLSTSCIRSLLCCIFCVMRCFCIVKFSSEYTPDWWRPKTLWRLISRVAILSVSVHFHLGYRQTLCIRYRFQPRK